MNRKMWYRKLLIIPKVNLFLLIYFSEIEYEEIMAKFFPNLMKTMYPQIQEQQNSSKLKTNHIKMHHNQIAGKKKQRQTFKKSQTKIKQNTLHIGEQNLKLHRLVMRNNWKLKENTMTSLKSWKTKNIYISLEFISSKYVPKKQK